MTKTSEQIGAKAWAIRLTQILNVVGDDNRFPINVADFSMGYSRQRFGNDAITLVKGVPLDGFEGALAKAPSHKLGWGILYNSAIRSPGRILYTQAHEFGHYLLHREKYPDGLQCGEDDTLKWDSELGQIEYEANVFAAWLLMPFDDLRRIIPGDAKPTIQDIGRSAERYGVSLTAAALRWLEYTARRSVLVVSRDGFILWSKPSKSALKTRAFIRTKNLPPRPVPESSLAASSLTLESQRLHNSGVWFNEPCEEHVLRSDQFDLTISLIHLEDADSADHFKELSSREPT